MSAQIHTGINKHATWVIRCTFGPIKNKTRSLTFLVLLKGFEKEYTHFYCFALLD